jgi:hypothetical protein
MSQPFFAAASKLARCPTIHGASTARMTAFHHLQLLSSATLAGEPTAARSVSSSLRKKTASAMVKAYPTARCRTAETKGPQAKRVKLPVRRGAPNSIFPRDLPPFSAHRIIRHFSTLGLRLRTAEPLKRSRPQPLSSRRQTPAASDIPSCCADALGCTLFATP